MYGSRFVAGTFNGTGATVYLCIGFSPDWVHVRNLQGTQIIEAYWNRNMQRASETVEGLQNTGAGSAVAALTKGTGIRTIFGGTTLATADVGTTTYGSAAAVYLKPFNFDCRFNSTDSPHSYYDAATATLDTWTLGSSTNYTGKFNGNVTGTYIGEGSEIMIDGRRYTIVALTAGAGATANDVTLSHSVNSGAIQYIGGKYSTIPMIAGEVTMDGFVLTNTTINVDSYQCAFEAGTWD